MTTSRPYPNESEDLEMHVNICAERYQQLDNRLVSLENDMTDIKQVIKDSNDSIRNTVITTAGAILVAIIAVLGTVLTQ
jgi:hypothetical protein